MGPDGRRAAATPFTLSRLRANCGWPHGASQTLTRSPPTNLPRRPPPPHQAGPPMGGITPALGSHTLPAYRKQRWVRRDIRTL